VGQLIKRKNRLIKTAWIELIEKRNMRQAAAIHVTSNVEASEVYRLGWDMPPVHVIPNGIDETSSIGNAEPSPDIQRIIERQPLVLFFGRLSWVKGLDRLLQAFALTREGNLAIVGTDDEGIVPQLSELSRSLGIAERVHFLPRTVRGADKDAVFAAAKLFVLASYSENFGNVVLEAMQQGVPVIVTPEIGAADVVKQAEGGLVVEGAPASLAEAITRLTENPELARAMGEQGRRYVSANCSWDRIAAEMETLYAGLLPTTAGSRC
jgi:glycosyltransferase involved in cell wall biosynthesis